MSHLLTQNMPSFKPLFNPQHYVLLEVFGCFITVSLLAVKKKEKKRKQLNPTAGLNRLL